VLFANLDVGCFPVIADAVISGSVSGRLDPHSDWSDHIPYST